MRRPRERLVQRAAAGRPPADRVPPQSVDLAALSAIRTAESKIEFDPMAHARAGRGLANRFRRAVLRLMRPYTYHQDELNRALVVGLRESAERVANLSHRSEELHRELQKLLSSLGAARADDLRRVVEAARARPASTHPSISYVDEHGRLALGFVAEERSEERSEYARFEDIFRGDERLIRERQRAYLRFFEAREWVAELGAGRGEFLDLLREAGIRGRGIDVDEEMVRRARDKGHDAELGDALDWLRAHDDASLPAVFAAQLVEHLPAARLSELLRELERKLEPDGVAVLETVNPHCPWAMKAFWTDPTHQHPLFPEVLLAMARVAGFHSGRAVFPGGTGNFDEDVYAVPDYAVVLGTRPVATARSPARVEGPGAAAPRAGRPA